MAVASTSTDTTFLTRTGSLLNYNAAYTRCGWFRINTDSNNYSHYMSVERDTDNYDVIGTDSDGTTLRLSTEVGGTATVGTGTNLAVNTWYHIALVRTSATVLKCFLNGVEDISVTSGSVAARAAATSMTTFGIAAFSAFCTIARGAALKEWTTNLTAAGLLSEMRQYKPVRWTNLNAWHPLWSNTLLHNHGPNSATWSTSGTINTAEGPPIPWEVGRRSWVIVPAAGGSFTATAALTIGGATASASATFAPGTKTATAAVTTGTTAAAISATHDDPDFTATAAVTIGTTETAASATFSPGTKTATVAATTGGTESAASATFAPGTKTATATPTIGGATADASATFSPGTKTASVTVTIGTTSANSSATFSPGTKTATVGATTGGADVTISSTFAPGTHTATIAITTGGVEISVSGTVDNPTYTATAALITGGATVVIVAASTETSPITVMKIFDRIDLTYTRTDSIDFDYTHADSIDFPYTQSDHINLPGG